MSGVEFSIDAHELKREISKRIHKKAVGITTDRTLYKEIGEILAGYIRAYLIGYGYDTGALSERRSGYSNETGYYRKGYQQVSLAHGIKWDAVEYRPGKEHHYAEGVFEHLFGGSEGEDIRRTMVDNGNWDIFIQDCARVIRRYMRNNK